MKPQLAAQWNLTGRASLQLQQQLATLVRLIPLGDCPRLPCAVAAAERDGVATAAALAGDQLVVARRPAPRPYLPGMFVFAVGPAIEAALDLIKLRPDLLLCLGHGIAHPRRCGLATHLGVLYGLPAIGVADRPLIGRYDKPPTRRGTWRPLRWQDETVGAALRTRPDTRPLIVSPGNLVTLQDCIKVVLSLTEKYRWPQPLRRVRQACRLASQAPEHSASYQQETEA